MAQMEKNWLAMRETQVQSLGWEDPLEEEMATHSSMLAWRRPWTVYGVAESDMAECLTLLLSQFSLFSRKWCVVISIQRESMAVLTAFTSIRMMVMLEHEKDDYQ